MKKRPKWSWNSQLLPILNKLFLQPVSFIWANSSFHLSHFFTVDNKFACVEGYSSSHPEASACLLFLRRDRIKKKKKNRMKKVSPVIKADWRSISSYGSRSCNHPPTGTTELIPAWGEQTLGCIKGLKLHKCAPRPHRPSYSLFHIHFKASFFCFLFCLSACFFFIQSRSLLLHFKGKKICFWTHLFSLLTAVCGAACANRQGDGVVHVCWQTKGLNVIWEWNSSIILHVSSVCNICNWLRGINPVSFQHI